jgi:D-hexose-6-phosphate mutarotase
MPESISLDGTIALPDGIRVVPGSGGLTKIEVDVPSARASVYLHGATVTEWTPAGNAPVLWLSEFSSFSPTQPIRGGIPICFPWFGANASDPALPNHGWARTSQWALVGAERVADDAVLTFQLTETSPGATDGAAPVRVLYRVSIGAELGLEFTVTNTGTDPYTFEEALHTYFAVDNVTTASVTGLEGLVYIDRTVNPEAPASGSTPVEFDGEQVDRIYPMPETVTLIDPGQDRSILVVADGASKAVVWNAGSAKAAAMADYGDEEWPQTACIEACNIRDGAVTLAPGASHTMTATASIAG